MQEGSLKRAGKLLKHCDYRSLTFAWINSRDYISAEAFILTLIAGMKLRDTTRNQIQFAWTQLCMFLATTIVKVTFPKGTALWPYPYIYLTQKPMLLLPLHHRHFHGFIRAADSTSTMVERLLSGQISKSTELEGWIKEQEDVFSTIAKTVHHSSKV